MKQNLILNFLYQQNGEKLNILMITYKSISHHQNNLGPNNTVYWVQGIILIN